jgi:hypothetical protein
VNKKKLVDANGLLEALFEQDARPSVRWVRQMQSQKVIPYYKIGHLIRFDVEEVVKALQRDCSIESKLV